MREAKKIKAAIIGLGPVGLILASKLNEAGWEVALVGRSKEKTDPIRKKGVILKDLHDSTTSFKKIYNSIDELAENETDLDYLIISMKSYQSEIIKEDLSVFNSDKISVISAQNGVDVEEILSTVFGNNKMLRLVVNYAGNMKASNIVSVTFFNPPNYIASIDSNRNNEANTFAEALNHVELDTKAISTTELATRSWEKTILNSALSALCGVTRLTMSEAMADENTVELVRLMIDEGIKVAEAEGIKISENFGQTGLEYLKKGGNHFPSLAGDLINSRQTEIDYFNAKIIKYGKKHNILTPIHLSFTYMVNAMTNKMLQSKDPSNGQAKIIASGLQIPQEEINNNKIYFTGVDLGSAFSKFSVIDEDGKIVFMYLLESLTNSSITVKKVMDAIHAVFNIKNICSTGYGRRYFSEADIVKTEINCAAKGVSHFYPGAKNIIDIGGEDIKSIKCDANNAVETFYMNDKCAAGTGSFIMEIAEKAQIDISKMSELAEYSDYEKELNSFCTVFAKTEIMKWLLDGQSLEDTVKGIYISITNRVSKMKFDEELPLYLIGGVIANHPYLQKMLSKKLNKDILIVEPAQYIVSLGAAVIAQQAYNKSQKSSIINATSIEKP